MEHQQHQVNGTTFYRWGNGDAPDEWARTMNNNRSLGKHQHHLMLNYLLPDDGSVKVQMGNQVVVPLTITPLIDEFTGEPTKIAGFEFEARFKTDQLDILRRQTGTCRSLDDLSKNESVRLMMKEM